MPAIEKKKQSWSRYDGPRGGSGWKNHETGEVRYQDDRPDDDAIRVEPGELSVNPLVAHHGSRHEFDKFSVDKIGTGEGAAAFGWGLYFTSQKDVAEHYRDKHKGALIDGVLVSEIPRPPSTMADAKYRLRKENPNATDEDAWEYLESHRDSVGEYELAKIISRFKDRDEVISQIRRHHDLMELHDRLEKSGRLKYQRGSVYDVDIPEKDELLPFDSSIDSLKPEIRAAIIQALPEYRIDHRGFLRVGGKMIEAANPKGGLFGKDVYHILKMKMGSAEAASKELKRLGVPGSTYNDNGVTNYVIFDDSDVSIRKRMSSSDEEPKKVKMWHLTNNPKFSLDSGARPEDNALSLMYEDRPGIYLTSNPEYWVNAYNYVRPFIAEIEVDESVLGNTATPGANQSFVPGDKFDSLSLKRVIPLDEYVREEFSSAGWVESYFDESLQERGNGKRFPDDYRYSGPDVREMSKKQTDRIIKMTKKYLMKNRGFSREDADSIDSRLPFSETETPSKNHETTKKKPSWSEYTGPRGGKGWKNESTGEVRYIDEKPGDESVETLKDSLSVNPLTAHHGSPHEFDKFTTEKIGTGEGAQAYGWGMYFADSEGIANHYRNMLTGSARYMEYEGELVSIEDLMKQLENSLVDSGMSQESAEHRAFQFFYYTRSDAPGRAAETVEKMMEERARNSGEDNHGQGVIKYFAEGLSFPSTPEESRFSVHGKKGLRTYNQMSDQQRMDMADINSRIYWYNSEKFTPEEAIAKVREQLEQTVEAQLSNIKYREKHEGLDPEEPKRILDAARRMIDMIDSGTVVPKLDKQRGFLYTVDLKPEEHELLDLDEKASSQKTSDAIREIYSKIDNPYRLFDEANGAQVYSEIEDAVGSARTNIHENEKVRKELNSIFGNDSWKELPKDRVASLWLASKGVRGLRFLDSTSRSLGTGTRNYVIFSDEDVEILKRMSSVSFARTIRMSAGGDWVRYEGRRGGKGWQNQVTKEVRYQEEKPFDESIEDVDIVPDEALLRSQLLRAFHGSPHQFEKFTTEKIGTGEGASAFGWGLYFADTKEVADYYAGGLSRQSKHLGGVQYSIVPTGDGKYFITSEVIDNGQKFDRSFPGQFDDFDSHEDAVNHLKKHGLISEKSQATKNEFDEWIVNSMAPNLYEVDLAPEEDEYLLWDRPITEQSESVKAALSAISPSDLGLRFSVRSARGNGVYLTSRGTQFGREVDAPVRTLYDLVDGSTGMTFYYNLAHQSGAAESESEQWASKFLHDHGIRGIKYLDNASRGVGATAGALSVQPDAAGKGFVIVTQGKYFKSGPYKTEDDANKVLSEMQSGQSYNYVIFDDADVSIVNRMSAWSKYDGPRGGRGWKNESTGEIRYQEDRPEDDNSVSGNDGPSGWRAGIVPAWDMTHEEWTSLSYEDFQKADTEVAKKLAELYWVKDKTKEQDSLYEKLNQVSQTIHDISNQHESERVARQEQAAERIKSGKPWSVTWDQFLNYHKTGSIPDNAYDGMTSVKGGMDFINKSRFTELLGTTKVNGRDIEIRAEREEANYVKYDEDGEIVRDEQGMAVMMTDEEKQSSGKPLFSIVVAAFDGSNPAGYAGDEFGATGVYVRDEYQKAGLGLKLFDNFMRQSGRLQRGRKIGQMTSGGVAVARAWHRQLVKDAIASGEDVPDDVLAEFNNKPDQTRKLVSWAKNEFGDEKKAKAFASWFGDSKIVNQDGTPRVMYHGTGAEFEAFSMDHAGQTDDGYYGRGIYFTPFSDEASDYGWNVIPVYISAKNPLFLPSSGTMGHKSMLDARDVIGSLPGMPDSLKTNRKVPDGYFVDEFEIDQWDRSYDPTGKRSNTRYAVLPKPELYDSENVRYGDNALTPDDAIVSFNDSLAEANWDHGWVSGLLKSVGRKQFVKALKEAGYDAVVVVDSDSEDGDFSEVVVFDPRQIKSAEENSGEFDPNEDRFRMSSWVRYEGPRKGHGWKHSETGEIRYQDDMPGDDDYSRGAEEGELDVRKYLPPSPEPGTLSDLDARKWYLHAETMIHDAIKPPPPRTVHQKAMIAFGIRNAARAHARRLMSDQNKAKELDQTDPHFTIEAIIARKRAKGLDGDAIWQDILDSSTKSRESVNKSLGLSA